MNNLVNQEWLSISERKLSMFLEISFTLASGAALAALGGPSKIDLEVQDAVSKEIINLEQQRQLLMAELKKYG